MFCQKCNVCQWVYFDSLWNQKQSNQRIPDYGGLKHYPPSSVMMFQLGWNPMIIHNPSSWPAFWATQRSPTVIGEDDFGKIHFQITFSWCIYFSLLFCAKGGLALGFISLVIFYRFLHRVSRDTVAIPASSKWPYCYGEAGFSLPLQFCIYLAVWTSIYFCHCEIFFEILCPGSPFRLFLSPPSVSSITVLSVSVRDPFVLILCIKYIFGT